MRSMRPSDTVMPGALLSDLHCPHPVGRDRSVLRSGVDSKRGILLAILFF